jgi:hypothetical protein
MKRFTETTVLAGSSACVGARAVAHFDARHRGITDDRRQERAALGIGDHFRGAARTVATSECVVPRSMPTASLRWCGSGASPGSEICSKGHMTVAGAASSAVDLFVELVEEPQLPHQRAAGVEVESAVDRALQRCSMCPRASARLACSRPQARAHRARRALPTRFAPHHTAASGNRGHRWCCFLPPVSNPSAQEIARPLDGMRSVR